MGKTTKIIIGLFLFSFLFRLIVVNQGLWLDEAIGAIAAHNYSYWGILTVFLKNDNHSPIFYLLLKVWASIFGFSDVSLRLLTVTAGSLLTSVVYYYTKKFRPKIALLSSIFIAISPFLIYYSQEVRMYIVAALFAVVSIFSFWQTTQKNCSNKTWIIFSISITALLFTDYLPVFLLPVFFISGLLWKKEKSWWRNLLLSFVPFMILGSLWLPIFLIQIKGGQTVLTYLPGWAALSGGATAKQAILLWNKFLLGRISIQPTKVYALFLAFFSVPAFYALFKSFTKRDKFINLIWLWLAVPVVLCFIASFIFPAFVYFRFTFVAPAFFILIANGLFEMAHTKRRALFTVWFVLGSVVGIYFYATHTENQREQWREAVSFVEKNPPKNAAAVFEFPEGFAPYKWYSTGKLIEIGGLSEISVQSGDDKRLSEKLRNIDSVYYFNYLRDLTDPQNLVKQTLSENGYRLVHENGDFQGVGVIELWQK